MLEQSNLLTNLLDQKSDKVDTSQGSLINDPATLEPTFEGPIALSEVKGSDGNYDDVASQQIEHSDRGKEEGVVNRKHGKP